MAVDEEGSQLSNNDERDLEENLSGSEYEEVSLATLACFSEECLDLLLQHNQPRLKSFPPKEFGKTR